MVRVDVHQYRLNPDRRFAKPVKSRFNCRLTYRPILWA